MKLRVPLRYSHHVLKRPSLVSSVCTRRFPCFTRITSSCSESQSLGLKSAFSGDVDPAYQEGSAFLRSLGLDNPAEIAKILDVAMNPNSLFVSFRDTKRAKNGNARKLSAKEDMEPVAKYLESRGLSKSQIASIFLNHPPTLSYSIPDRIQPLVEYLEETGIKNVPEVIVERPSLLGLEAENIRSIVDYLQDRDYTTEQIAEYLATTI